MTSHLKRIPLFPFLVCLKSYSRSFALYHPVGGLNRGVLTGLIEGLIIICLLIVCAFTKSHFILYIMRVLLIFTKFPCAPNAPFSIGSGA